MSIITSPINILKNINQTLINCDIEIAKFISKSFALGVQCLNTSDFNFGSTIVDFDYEKTSVALFKNSALIYSSSIPIGINHITKDISRGCSLSLEESENIKNKIKLNDLSEDKTFQLSKSGFLNKDFFKTSNYRKISIELIKKIKISRIDEIFRLLKKEINFSGLEKTAGKNVLISSAKCTLPELKQLFSKYFGCNIREIKSNEIVPNDKNYTNLNACYGAVKIIHKGFETEAIAQEKNKKYW